MSPLADEDAVDEPRGDTVLAGSSPRSGGGAVLLVLAAAAPAAIWFLHLNVSYVLVPPACDAGSAWSIGLATAVALVAMVLPVRRSWRAWRGDGGDGLVGMLGAAGVLLTCIFVLAVLLVGGSALVVDPCR